MVDPKDYSWNEHERETRQTKGIPSKSKIKLLDDFELRSELEKRLETLTHRQLAQWALANSEPFFQYFDAHLKDDQRIEIAKQAFLDKIDGKLSAYEFRKVGFLANQLAKESETELSRRAARVFAQAIAAAHMRGHGLVSADYGVKVVNLLYPGALEKVRELRKTQIENIKKYERRS